MSVNTDWHTERPSVYLDQWVWIRLGRASAGRPTETGDAEILKAVLEASDDGVAFPLTATHYIETLKRQQFEDRDTVGSLMIRASRCRTLRARDRLFREQILMAMHELFDRPTFPPEREDPLGVGIHWAFKGTQAELNVHVLDDAPPEILEVIRQAGRAEDLCRLQQWAEMQYLVGPRDDQISVLRREYGYRPEALREVEESRLAWEQDYSKLLTLEPVETSELMFRARIRTLIHEHFDRLQAILAEFRMPAGRIWGDPVHPSAENRETVTRFIDAVPSFWIQSGLNAEIHRDSNINWTINHIHDIDWLSIVVPYCHVVVPDKQMWDLSRRIRATERCGTQIVRRLGELPELLDDLRRIATPLGDDGDGWDWRAPGVGFDPIGPEGLLAERNGSDG